MSKADGGNVFFSFAMSNELNQRVEQAMKDLYMNKRTFVIQAIEEKLSGKTPVIEQLPSEVSKEEFEKLKSEVATLRKITDTLTLSAISKG